MLRKNDVEELLSMNWDFDDDEVTFSMNKDMVINGEEYTVFISIDHDIDQFDCCSELRRVIDEKDFVVDDFQANDCSEDILEAVVSELEELVYHLTEANDAHINRLSDLISSLETYKTRYGNVPVDLVQNRYGEDFYFMMNGDTMIANDGHLRIYLDPCDI